MGLPVLAYDNLAARRSNTISASPEHATYTAARLGNGRCWERLWLTAGAGHIDVTIATIEAGYNCAALIATDLPADSTVTFKTYTDAARTSLAFSQALIDRGDGRLWWATFSARTELYARFLIEPVGVAVEPGEIVLDVEAEPDTYAKIGEVFIGPHVQLARGFAAGGVSFSHDHASGGQESDYGTAETYALAGPREAWQLPISNTDPALRAQVLAAKNACMGNVHPFLLVLDDDQAAAWWCRGANSLSGQNTYTTRYGLSWSIKEEPHVGPGVDW